MVSRQGRPSPGQFSDPFSPDRLLTSPTIHVTEENYCIAEACGLVLAGGFHSFSDLYVYEISKILNSNPYMCHSLENLKFEGFEMEKC